jgi:formylglycine-generating enzyme
MMNKRIRSLMVFLPLLIVAPGIFSSPSPDNASAVVTGEMEIRGPENVSPVTYRKFAVNEKEGRIVSTTPVQILPAEVLPNWAIDVSQEEYDWTARDCERPLFADPIPFVIPPLEDSEEPFYPHNHCPAITWLPNGDLLAIWFSTIREQGTEMTILASRFRAGASEWEPASEFFKGPDRNMTGSSIFYDQTDRVLHHLNGIGRKNEEGWANLALLHRMSADNGVTWSAARPVSTGAAFESRHQVIAGMSRTRDGVLIQPCDATHGGQGPTAIHISRDGGKTWFDPGGDIRGIHAGVVDLIDGRLLALGRGQPIDGNMPKSVSDDMGESWTYSASEFPPIGSAQRLVLKRLREGPLLLASYTAERTGSTGMSFHDCGGNQFEGVGLFAAVSYDEGETWPVRKLLNTGPGSYEVGPYFGAAVRRAPVVTTTATEAEREGYLAATQSPDGVIHLISSRLYYRFNLAWIEKGTR